MRRQGSASGTALPARPALPALPGSGAGPGPGASLDDEPWFVGPVPGDSVRIKLAQGRDGDYVVWETNQGGYTLSVLENGHSCAHYSITKLGTEFRLDATFTLYPSIPAIISATPAARTSAKALVVDDWVPSSASAAATLLAGSSGAGFDVYDDGDVEQFGGFGGDGGFGGSDLPAEETDQLYMNSE